MLGTTEWLDKLWPLERYSAPQSLFSVSVCSTYVIFQQIHIISLCQKLMWPIQFQSHLNFPDLPNGIF
jgi:hypothetical protein